MIVETYLDNKVLITFRSSSGHVGIAADTIDGHDLEVHIQRLLVNKEKYSNKALMFFYRWRDSSVG